MTKLKLAAYAVLIPLVLYGGWKLEHHGYQRAATEYQSRIDRMAVEAADARTKELERQDAANSEAKRREARRIAEMQEDAQKLEDLVKELQREASQDPDAGKPAISASGVQRINKIR